MTVYYKQNGTPYKFIPQDDVANRKWTWKEEGFTVYRSNARTGPGCHSNCGVLLYVKDGLLHKVQGDPENPFNQGRLCPRCLAVKEIMYHPDRLKYPLKRAGKRGDNKWQRITWDEAYDTIEKRFKDIIAEYGAESIMVTQGTGRDINGYLCRLAYTIGTPNQTGWLAGLACYLPRMFCTNLKLGNFVVADCSQFFPERYDHPDYKIPEYIIIWGNNPVVSNSDGFLGHWIVELMKRGTKLITVDPKLTWLASKSEFFLQIRPGTDAALALAIGNVICGENLCDEEFVKKWTDGYDLYARRVKDYPPESVSEICGVDVDLILGAARAIGKARSVALQWGAAVDQVVEPFQTASAMLDFIALTGNIEKPGSMLVGVPAFGVKNTWEGGWGAELLSEEQNNKRLNHRYPFLQFLNLSSAEMVRESMLYGNPHQMKACWIQTTNPLANSTQNPIECLQALQNMEFNVVVDLFMTPTALAIADIVLPAATYAERPGLCGHQPYYLGAIVQAVDPLGECKSDQQIIYELAGRFNKEANPWENDVQLYDSLLEPLGITFNDMKERTWAYPPFEYYKHEKGLLRTDKLPGFNTKSGKYEFYCAQLEQIGIDPLAYYTEPVSSPVSTPDLAAEYPLILTTGARRTGFFLSEHRQSPSLRKMHPDPLVTINTKTAAEYNIKDGDWVWVENNHGRCKLKAEVTLAIRPDVVSADNGWWFPERNPDDGTFFGTFESNCNVLLTMECGELGLGSTIKSVLCKIYKAEEDDR